MIKKIVSKGCIWVGIFLMIAELTACDSMANAVQSPIGWGRSDINLSGSSKSIETDLSPFDSVSAIGPFDINFQFVPNEYYINLTGDSALVNNVSYMVRDGILQIRANQEFEYVPTYRLMITIGVPQLNRLHYRGPGKVALLNVASNHLIIDGEGSGFFYVTGSATRLDATMSGTSRLDARCLKTRTAFVNTVHLAQAEVASDGGVSALAADASDIYYYGSPGLAAGYQNNSGSALRMSGIGEVPSQLNTAAQAPVPTSTMKPTYKKQQQATRKETNAVAAKENKSNVSIYENYSDLNR